MQLWHLIIPIFLLALFFILYRINRTSLVPSCVFTLFLFAFTGIATGYIVYYSSNIILRWILVLLLLPFGLITVFGVYVLIAFLLLNAKTVFKKEKRTLAHSLTFILAVALILYSITMRFVNAADVNEWSATAKILLLWIEGMVFCYSVHVTQFIVATVLCNLSRPRRNQDYIIVLGAWLKEGLVSPLLAKRIDRAIAFYNKQKKSGKPPKLILSGGQGRDEIRSEAEAMAEYARENGIAENDMILESQSANTLQNMQYSKIIMDRYSKNKPYNVIYATSGYHLLRAGIYARQAGLKISGIGAKTAFYYVPAALLREYIAYIVLHKKRNIAFALLGFLFSCAIVAVKIYL